MKLLMKEYPTWLFSSGPFSISASTSPWWSFSASTPPRSFSTSTSSATAIPGRRFFSATV